MKNGRINERNTGSHKLDSGAKRAKAVIGNLTDEQIKVKEDVSLCRMILKDGVKVYDNIPELVQYWINNGIAQIKEFENTCIPARTYKPFEERAVLNENKRSDIELVQNLMISLYKL